MKAGDWTWWRTSKSKRRFAPKAAFSALSALLVLWLIIMWYPGSGDDYLVSGGGREADGAAGEVKALEGGPAVALEPKRATYGVIARKNLFNPKRKEKWAVRKAAPGRPPRARSPIVRNTRDTLVLEGVVVFDGKYTAFVKDTAKPRDGVLQVLVGDVVGEFTVTAIKDEELTLKGAGGTIKTLKLYNEEKPVKRKVFTTPLTPRKRPAPTRLKNTIR